jgi:hypothetical protein
MEPKYPRGPEPLKVTAEMVFTAVKSIIAADKEAEFLALCEKRKATVTVSAEDVTFLKRFLFEGNAHKKSALAQRVLDSDRCTH